jgi:hypothetical protein
MIDVSCLLHLPNVAMFQSATCGVADFRDGCPYEGFRNLAATTAHHGVCYRYGAEGIEDPGQWERGIGRYDRARGVIERLLVERSSNGNAIVDFSAPPAVTIIAWPVREPCQTEDVVSA